MTDTPPPAAPTTPEQQDQTLATVATFLNIIILIPALIFYFGFKDRGPKIAAQSKENLNWSLGIAIIAIGAPIVSAILGWIPVLGWIIAILLAIVAWLAGLLNLIFSIIGGIRVSRGEFYSYPFTIKFVK